MGTGVSGSTEETDQPLDGSSNTATGRLLLDSFLGTPATFLAAYALITCFLERKAKTFKTAGTVDAPRSTRRCNEENETATPT